MKLFHQHDWLEVNRELLEKIFPPTRADGTKYRTGEIHTFITERCRICGKWRQHHLLGNLTNTKKEAVDEWAVPRD